MQAMYPARRRSLAGMVWALRTLLEKKRITWEDRLGLYRYRQWIHAVEQPALKLLLRDAQEAAGLAIHPIFVIAGEAPAPEQAERTLSSLRSFADTPWTLVFFLSENTPPSVEEQLLTLNCAGGHVCALRVDFNDNPDPFHWQAALADLPGDWVIPLRAGDRMSAHWPALFRLFLRRQPHADLLYWDEDQYHADGAGPVTRERPFFKPAWSPDLLVSRSFIESAAFRKSYLLAAPAAGLNLAVLRAEQTARIPVVLQHRAPLSESAAAARRDGQARAACVILAGQGAQNPTAAYDEQGNLRARWDANPPLVSIIIPTRENLGYLKRCLTTLLERTQGVPYEVILMDDHSSSPEVLEYYRALEARHENVRVHHNAEPFNYSRVNNQGARLAKGELLLFLNNDVEILHGGWLLEMARWALLPGVGMVGARLLYPDRSIQHAGIVLGMTGHAGHLYAGNPPAETELFLSPGLYRNVSAVTGACMMARREVFEQVGGFDEELILVFNDVELCQRVREAGWRIVYTPAAELIHHEGRSRSRYMPPRDLRLGAERLRMAIQQGDPYYHPGLSLSVNWPTLRRAGEPGGLQRLNDILRYKG